MLVIYLSNKLTEQLHILQNTSSPEKVRFLKVTNYFCFMRNTKGDYCNLDTWC